MSERAVQALFRALIPEPRASADWSCHGCLCQFHASWTPEGEPVP